MMDVKLLSLRTTRWGAAATAVAKAAALCVPATQAVVVAGAGASAGSGVKVAAKAGGFSDDEWGDRETDVVSMDAYGKNQAELDPGSMYTVGKAIGALGLWSKTDKSGRRLTGQGVGVAVMDSGVDQIAGLSGAGKVTYGPDLSIEGNGVLAHKDTFGHGTFMAGIIAGRGTTTSSSGLSTADADVQLGVAPDATDNRDALNGWTYDHTRVASFSQIGSSNRHVDVVAPGTSLVSVRDPGSAVDVNNPSGLVLGDVSGKLFRGSGTSQAAEVVSGSVALLLQAYPSLTPDQVKYALRSTAHSISNTSTNAGGDGTIDLSKALYSAGQVSGSSGPTQSFSRSTGQGSLNTARGGSILYDATGADLTGEVDVQGNPWNPAAWWQASSNLTSWSGGTWRGGTWTGDDWDPAYGGLTSSRWSSSRWSTADWASLTWTSSRWSSSRWSSALWCSSRWSFLFWS